MNVKPLSAGAVAGLALGLAIGYFGLPRTTVSSPKDDPKQPPGDRSSTTLLFQYERDGQFSSVAVPCRTAWPPVDPADWDITVYPDFMDELTQFANSTNPDGGWVQLSLRPDGEDCTTVGEVNGPVEVDTDDEICLTLRVSFCNRCPDGMETQTVECDGGEFRDLSSCPAPGDGDACIDYVKSLPGFE